MKYKELQKIAEDNGYEIKTEIDYVVLTKYEEDNIIKISTIKEDIIFSTMYACMPRDFQMLKASLELAETPLDERQEEKIYIVPLPHLILSDGEQIYLTYQGNFFPSIRDKSLKQTWKEKDLIHIPKEYRDFAVEIVEVE